MQRDVLPFPFVEGLKQIFLGNMFQLSLKGNGDSDTSPLLVRLRRLLVSTAVSYQPEPLDSIGTEAKKSTCLLMNQITSLWKQMFFIALLGTWFSRSFRKAHASFIKRFWRLQVRTAHQRHSFILAFKLTSEAQFLVPSPPLPLRFSSTSGAYHTLFFSTYRTTFSCQQLWSAFYISWCLPLNIIFVPGHFLDLYVNVRLRWHLWNLRILKFHAPKPPEQRKRKTLSS